MRNSMVIRNSKEILDITQFTTQWLEDFSEENRNLHV